MFRWQPVNSDERRQIRRKDWAGTAPGMDETINPYEKGEWNDLR